MCEVLLLVEFVEMAIPCVYMGAWLVMLVALTARIFKTLMRNALPCAFFVSAFDLSDRAYGPVSLAGRFASGVGHHGAAQAARLGPAPTRVRGRDAVAGTSRRWFYGSCELLDTVGALSGGLQFPVRGSVLQRKLRPLEPRCICCLMIARLTLKIPSFHLSRGASTQSHIDDSCVRRSRRRQPSIDHSVP
ncbi:hypothetical protein PybrP1_008604 [[Pythium] brassicae (nom. inval.)]|nr:hypothetical protein PybrP1_008604 [[Pythium] brassicae (nom. inval.)]